MAVARSILVGRPAKLPFSSFLSRSSELASSVAVPILCEGGDCRLKTEKFESFVGPGARCLGERQSRGIRRASNNRINCGGCFNLRASPWEIETDLERKGGSHPRGFFSMAAATSQTTSVDEHADYQIQEQILSHQKAAAKLPAVEEARTLVHQTTIGTLSTISKKYDGFPVGSVVTYAADDDGSILLSISSLSPHTRDLQLNPKCSLLVAKDPTDRSDTFVTIVGEASTVSDEDVSAVRDKYLKRHPGAVWVDFGDFKFVRIQPQKVRYVSGLITGLAAVAEFASQQFQAAAVDPISQFAGPIAGHMNRDHADQTAQIVENSLAVKVDSAIIRDVDRFGFGVLAKREREPVKLRIPFPRPAEDRKDVKNLIIEMLKGRREN